jgi:hypothetical protein
VTEKRRVVMTNVFATPTPDGGPVTVATHQATDYVPVDILDAYVADARTRWALVEVGDSHDGGPAENGN